MKKPGNSMDTTTQTPPAASSDLARLGERFDTGFLPSNIEPTHFICRDCGDTFPMDAECGVPNGQAGVYVGSAWCIVRRFCQRCVDARYAGKPSDQAAIPFEDNRGNAMQLDGKLTITDLAKLGVKEIRLMPEGSPLPDNWWRDAGSHAN
jgi:hypothetical protein